MDNSDTQNSNYIKRLINDGVTFIDPKNVYIAETLKIYAGAIIYPMVCLYGATEIRASAVIYPFCDLTDTFVAEGCEVRSTYATGARIGAKSCVGPFTCLRRGAAIGERCRVGDFVEIKNSVLADGVKAAHLAYVGDSIVGERTNIGCGTVFANYNGKIKQGVTVGKDVFIGCNANLVAPLTVCDGAFIAAGSTVTRDIPPNALCVARAREYVKNDWRKEGER